MGLFGSKEDKEAKQQEKMNKMLAKYGLQSLTDPQDIQSVQTIVGELAGTSWMEAGNLLAPDEKTANQIQIAYQRTLVEQNFIIIRQLDKIANLLNK
jgi:hypothetical protein